MQTTQQFKHFSSMTVDEFVRLNQDSIPEVIQQYLQHQHDKITELQEELQVNKKKREMLREQVYFGQDLVSNIDIFVSNNLSKRLQTEYGKIRECANFET